MTTEQNRLAKYVLLWMFLKIPFLSFEQGWVAVFGQTGFDIIAILLILYWFVMMFLLLKIKLPTPYILPIYIKMGGAVITIYAIIQVVGSLWISLSLCPWVIENKSDQILIMILSFQVALFPLGAIRIKKTKKDD